MFVVGLTLAQVGTLSTLPVFWSLPTAFLSGIAAAGGIAWINSVGNLGGFFAPTLVGVLRDATRSYVIPLTMLAIILAAGGVCALCFRHDPIAEKPLA